MRIFNVDLNSVAKVSEFLSDVPSIEEIEEEVLNNACYIEDEDGEVCGIISYEKFEIHGLIRYFVFKKSIENDIILELFNKIVLKAKLKGVEKLFAIINKIDVKELFELLGFSEFDKELLFINEESFLNGIYRDATVMMLEI